MKFRVHYQDGTTKDLTIGSREQVAVERKYDVNYVAVFDKKDGRVEYVYYLAWAGLRNADPESAPEDFDAWLALISDVEPLAGEAARPTRRGQRRAASST